MRTLIQSVSIGASALALTSLCITTPAFGRGPADPRVSAPELSKADGENKRICRKMGAITGSQLDRRVCKTRTQWEAEGFTVTKRKPSTNN